MDRVLSIAVLGDVCKAALACRQIDLMMFGINKEIYSSSTYSVRMDTA